MRTDRVYSVEIHLDFDGYPQKRNDLVVIPKNQDYFKYIKWYQKEYESRLPNWIKVKAIRFKRNKNYASED